MEAIICLKQFPNLVRLRVVHDSQYMLLKHSLLFQKHWHLPMIKLLHFFTLLTSRCPLLLHRFPPPTSAKVKVKNGLDLHLESTLVSRERRNSWTLSLPTEVRWPPWYLEELLLSKKGYVVDISPARFFPIPPRLFCFAQLVAFVRMPEE